ncbi:hypothetical protein PR202_ga25283 [Eleusine coracana subsp. coracana]|uniref:Mitochondrial splicing suppressor 51-like C-terminal domain-containing protein n=1 Tax=Eleusine coracana subsp. coracana TaxID=191504 RepID=A0AAV5DBT5_ELECO|nr:hypothetical protein PR202_ga25283 [Eleusine coracana subsp. coracana]
MRRRRRTPAMRKLRGCCLLLARPSDFSCFVSHAYLYSSFTFVFCTLPHCLQILHWKVHKGECERLEKQMSHIDMLSQFPFTFSMEPLEQSLRTLFSYPYQVGKTIIIGDPFRWIHPLQLYFIGGINFAATNYISLPSTISLPNLKVKLGHPVHSLFRDGEVISISRYANCSDESCCCKSSTGSEDLNCSAVTLKLWKGFYHERYSDIMKDSNPHLIFAPNAGVAAYPSWVPTIELIRGTGIPAFFTDFCEEAAHLASGCISSITGQPLRVPVQVNPFRQPIAVDNTALFLPCYSNCFVLRM